jgi:hypothetical protein
MSASILCGIIIAAKLLSFQGGIGIELSLYKDDYYAVKGSKTTGRSEIFREALPFDP